MAGIYPSSPYIGMISNRQIQTRMVCEGFNCIIRDAVDHVKAPKMPEMVTMTLIMAKAVDSIPRVVLANKIAVPETVAIASEIINQAAKNKSTSLSRRARRMVL